MCFKDFNVLGVSKNTKPFDQRVKTVSDDLSLTISCKLIDTLLIYYNLQEINGNFTERTDLPYTIFSNDPTRAIGMQLASVVALFLVILFSFFPFRAPQKLQLVGLKLFKAARFRKQNTECVI